MSANTSGSMYRYGYDPIDGADLIDPYHDVIASGLSLEDAEMFVGLLNAQSAELASLRARCDAAPILSKYHGQRGFEVERFINDYTAWRDSLTAERAKDFTE